MARSKEQRLGVLIAENAGGGEAIITVAKIGREFRIRYAGKEHLSYSSVRDIDDVKREVLPVFNVRNSVFASCEGTKQWCLSSSSSDGSASGSSRALSLLAAQKRTS